MDLFKHISALCLAALSLAASPVINDKIIGTIEIDNNNSVFVPNSILNIYIALTELNILAI